MKFVLQKSGLIFRSGGDNMKILKAVCLLFLSLILAGLIHLFEIKDCMIGNNIAGVLLGISLPGFWHSIQDITDTENWKESQRKLMRGHFISSKTIVRVSFAYLFRIKIGTKYLLVENSRGTGKYQPVGGVYKLSVSEKDVLRRKYQVKDDDKIAIDESSRDDYRLRMENKYLRRFVRRFDMRAERERINNLSREFKEELVETGILDWNQISYRYCGRHMTTLQFSEHFQIYELLLADVVELIPTKAQEHDLSLLLEKDSSLYRFATADEIISLGINTELKLLKETISDHTQKIIEEHEGHLLKKRGTGKKHSVRLGT